MQCWKCGADCGAMVSSRKIGFRQLCEKCHAALHSCKNCLYYEVGRSNDCKIPGTDFIADRTAPNFCEEFFPLGIERKEMSREEAKKRFDDLFK